MSSTFWTLGSLANSSVSGSSASAVGAGAAAVTSAIADALGGKCLCRTPLTTDVILAELEGRPQPAQLTEIHI